MARKVVERNIAYDDVKLKYYVTLDYGKNEYNKRIKKTKTFEKIADARKCLRNFEVEKDNQNIILPKKETVESYFRYWLNDIKSVSCKPATLYGYSNIIDNHIIPFIGKVELQKLTAKHINGYCAHLKKDKKLDNNTIKKHQDLLKSMLKTATNEKIIHENFMENMELIKNKHREVAVYNQEQVQQLFKLIKGHPLELGVKLALYLGLRRGEINGLKWKNVHLQEKYIYIVDTRTQAGKNEYRGDTKTDMSKRTLELSSELVELLKRTKEKQEEDKRLFGKSYYDTDYVFRKPNGKLYRVNYLSATFKIFLDKNSLPRIKFHALRHTCATMANKMGITLYDIASMLGHSSPSITSKIYTHQLDKTNSKATMAVADAYR